MNFFKTFVEKRQKDSRMYDLVIRNCHVLLPAAEVRPRCDLVIDAGKIENILPTGEADTGQAHEVLDLIRL